eukprot:gnl/MRDRNA2_/MRDRNA2_84207_c0_seq1.p1 gnl/MRDRNA2_/MRDRNA2_84207_c0~~gnl/MRDRNA2_/MRDRNA2_84207_c0_seq1.p1  ORF type:complete len:132 (-),score=21.90 gnl/MRDRNA2_/MRDRNA2_84207_c0_seq1:140-535(-)
MQLERLVIACFCIAVKGDVGQKLVEQHMQDMRTLEHQHKKSQMLRKVLSSPVGTAVARWKAQQARLHMARQRIAKNIASQNTGLITSVEESTATTQMGNSELPLYEKADNIIDIFDLGKMLSGGRDYLEGI